MMRKVNQVCGWCLVVAALSWSSGGFADDVPAVPATLAFPAEQIEYFELHVRPLLVAECQACHGKQQQEGDLRVDSRTALVLGGERGAAIDLNDPESSLLWRAVQYDDGELQMPPAGKLAPPQIEILRTWLAMGAPWTPHQAEHSDGRDDDVDSFQIRPEDRRFWSFQPLAPISVPSPHGFERVETVVDAYILERLEAAGGTLAERADKRTLIRRVTFDLIGLPPTPSELQAFLDDDSPEAFPRVVERLLGSPHFGERAARLWLDVARYGEDQAHTFEARQYPQGFRYRDWVVRARNSDLRYDEFVRQQLAADLLEGGEDPERLAPLGFMACGPVYYGDKNDMDQISDRIDTLTRGFLGLTVACARCHDHKYDPISAVDYYALAGVFASTEYVEVPLVSEEEVRAAEEQLTEQEKKQKRPPKKYPFVHALADKSEPRNMPVHIRGSTENLGAEAPRRFLEVLVPDEPTPFTRGSGRLELAEAIASPDNPLTARVVVNRIWQQHFGQGLVRTAGNFGFLGERPTHPELLDYLARRLIESEWSLKAIHREIVLSATYQQRSEVTPFQRERDPENRLWGRVQRRRLDVESWRDAMLSVSGQLDRTFGGQSLSLSAPDNRRRTLYGHVSRHELHPLLRLFDFPDPNITSDERPRTTVPLQQLFVLNSEFMIENARALSARLAHEGATDAQRIELAFQWLLGRSPEPDELELGLAYLRSSTPTAVADGASDSSGAVESSPSGSLSQWERYAQVLLATNEFFHLD